MRIGVGVGVVDFGFTGGVADAADGSSLAALMLLNETNGVAIDFTDLSMQIKDTITPANVFSGDPNSKLTYTSPSTKWILGANGIYTSGTTLRTEYNASGTALGLRVEEARTNLFLNSRAPVTQDITTTAQSYTISGLGAAGATLVISGTATGTLTGTAAVDRDKLTFTATAGTLAVTVSGTWDFVQVEAGAFATSPIVTAGATVTRAIDNISLLASLFPYSATASTIFGTFVRGVSDVFGTALQVSNGNTNNRLVLIDDTVNFVAQVRDVTASVTYTSNLVGANPLGTPFKAALAAAANDANSAYNGVAGVTDTAVTMPSTAATSMYFGSVVGAAGTSWNGWIKQAMYVPRRMSNAELQTVTT